VPRTIPPVVPAGRMREREQPTLGASGLTVRPWAGTDAAGVVLAFADPDIRFWHMRELADEDEARTWIANWRERWDAETDGSWAVTDTETDDLLGQVALRTVDLEFGQGQITYWVLPAHRGDGVATRAVREVSRWALEDLGVHRLIIEHSTANEASCRVAQKAGFALEGTMRSHLLHADGWHDMHLHARINKIAAPRWEGRDLWGTEDRRAT
jgi:[ribosomal protein S5]-alanine N-acetyltransferase